MQSKFRHVKNRTE